MLLISEPVAVILGAIGPCSRFEPEQHGNADSEVAGFFRNSIRRGDLLIIVELADSTFRNRAESIFENQHAVAAAVNPT